MNIEPFSQQIGSYEIHPLANYFPMMSGDQLAKFEADLKKHGLQNPVVLFEGKILDGRNRALIAHKLGWKIKTIKFEDIETEKTPLDFVISSNSIGGT